MREIKFRVFSTIDKPKMIYLDLKEGYSGRDLLETYDWKPMQYTGLKDKNGHGQEVYECDIIDKDGKVIGNQYENPTLLKDPANLLIQGFGTKDWETTNKKAMDRGLAYSE